MRNKPKTDPIEGVTVTIVFSNLVKFFGMIIEDRLRFIEQVEKLCSKAKQRAKIVYRFYFRLLFYTDTTHRSSFTVELSNNSVETYSPRPLVAKL